VEALDLLVLLVYFGGLLAIGFFFTRKTKTASQMFVAGRQSPWWISGLSAYMTMFSAGTFVIWGGIAYEFGFVAISISLGYGVAAFIAGYFIAGRWRQSGLSTGAEFIQKRYGSGAFHFYTWFYIIMAFGTGLTIYALAVLICPLIIVPEGWFIRDATTGFLSVPWAVAILGAIIIVYTMSGGLWAVLMTDTLQFYVLTLSVLVVVPLSFHHVGGIGRFLELAPENFMKPTAGEFTCIFLVGWMLSNMFSLGASWQFLQRYFCVSTPGDARKTLYLFGVLYLTTPFLWMAPPMIYRVVNPNADPKEAYILMCKEVLPAGMIGMMVAAMFSATASMISSVLNVYASVLTDDVYKRLIRPQATEKQTVRFGRIITVTLGVYMIAGGILIPGMTSYQNWVLVFGSVLGPSLLLPTIWALWSRRVTKGAVWWSVIFSIIAWALIKFGFAADGWFGDMPSTQGIINWIAAHKREADLLTGIIIALGVLTFFEFRSRREAPGWQRLQDAFERETQEPVPVVDATGPAKVMAWALGFLGAIVLLIAIFSSEQKTVLFVCALVLILMSGAFVYVLRKKEVVRVKI